jgi:hypothetical protein
MRESRDVGHWSRQVGALAVGGLHGEKSGIVRERLVAPRRQGATVLVELSRRLESPPSRRRGFSAADGVQAAAA